VTRYTEKQKLAAVTAYRKGAGGLRATASAHDVGVDSLRAWIAAYEANGKAGLVAKRRVIYDLDFKLEVLRRMQDKGLSCRQVAALFNIRRLDLVTRVLQVWTC
jgi:transposase